MTVQPAKLLLALFTLAAVGVSACSGPEPEYGFDGLCRGSGSLIAREFHSPDSNWTVQWTPDGSQILFDYFGVIPEKIRWLEVPAIYAVHVSGRPVEKVLDLPSRDDGHGAGLDTTVFDLSADGSRIAYAACALSEESLLIGGTDKRVYSYEIFVSNFDGANVKRLTNNTHFDVLPAWSPDGESLAFISDPDRSIFWRESIGTGRGSIKYTATTRITVHEVATGESREIGLPAGYAAAPIRLEWSPSGDRIAVVVLEGEKSPWNLAVYTVGADGTGLTRVSDAASGPTWSPSGDRIAFVVLEGEKSPWNLALYTFATDGSNLVKEEYRLDSIKLDGWPGTEFRSGLWMGNLSWSPDGSAILIERFRREGGPAVIPLGTGGVEAGLPGGTPAGSRAMTGGAGAGSILASPLNSIPALFHHSAWSPDGAQIAVRSDIAEFFDIEVVDREGNTRVVLDWEREFR